REPYYERPVAAQQDTSIPEEAIPPPVGKLSYTFLSVPAPTPAPLVNRMKVRRRSLASILTLPLLWMNRGFDHGTVLLGAPGRWLRSTLGRNVLGLGGILFLAAALAW